MEAEKNNYKKSKSFEIKSSNRNIRRQNSALQNQIPLNRPRTNDRNQRNLIYKDIAISTYIMGKKLRNERGNFLKNP